MYFQKGSDDIPAKGRDRLAQTAAAIRRLPAGTVVEVRGHTDITGPRDANQALSQRRADVVREELIRLGVPADMLEAKGYGELGPIRNRSVSYSVLK